MQMWKAAMAVAAILLGAIAALVGLVLLVSAMQTGEIHMSTGSGSAAVNDVVTRIANPERFWKLVTGLGIAPVVLGSLAARWGWRRMSGR